MNAPERLEDVKVGDTVWLFGGMGLPIPLTVQRLTPNQFITDGDFNTRYWRGGRKDGDEVGGSYFIRVGEQAARLLAQRQRDKRIQNAIIWPIRINGAEPLSRSLVLAYRAACDRAEAALRELGEWADVP